MEKWVSKYNELRSLYSKVDTKQDSISKGIATEKIVNELLCDIVKPYRQDINFSTGDRRFDGRIVLGQTRSILYEIELGVLPKFKYYRILNDVSRGKFFGKNFFLIIAYKFAEDDKTKMEELIDNSYRYDSPVSFMDYETLIELHEFVSRIESENEQELKFIKKLFLERLFQTAAIIDKSCFLTALSNAKERASIKFNKSEPALSQNVIVQSSKYDERLDRLEQIARNLLEEIQALKYDLKNKEREYDFER
jgi:hypothetical protein